MKRALNAMERFIVKLVDGTILNMSDECNHVSYNKENMCVFSNMDKDTNTYKTLAIIPYDKIMYIFSKQ